MLSSLDHDSRKPRLFPYFFPPSSLHFFIPFFPLDKKARCTGLLEGEGNCIVHCLSERTIIRLRLSVSSLRFSSREEHVSSGVEVAVRRWMPSFSATVSSFLPFFFDILSFEAQIGAGHSMHDRIHLSFFYRIVDDFPFTWKYLRKQLIFLARKIFKKGVSSFFRFVSTRTLAPCISCRGSARAYYTEPPANKPTARQIRVSYPWRPRDRRGLVVKDFYWILIHKPAGSPSEPTFMKTLIFAPSLLTSCLLFLSYARLESFRIGWVTISHENLMHLLFQRIQYVFFLSLDIDECLLLRLENFFYKLKWKK